MLAIDIGNTTIALGIVKKGRVVVSLRLDTTDSLTLLKPFFTRNLNRLLNKGYDCKRVVICSVVPQTTKLIEQLIQKILKVECLVVGRDIVVPMKNKYTKPSQVGQDRLVGAYAAMKMYGKPLIVVDLGTAITFDVISKQGDYLGGAIVPGIRLSAEALFLKTALLPQIDIKAPKNPIGRTTQESMLSGIFYGYGVLCQGLIDVLAQQIKAKPKVVMTGGHTQLMKKFVSPKIRIIDEDLIFKGLYLLALESSDR
jgi:type III pantothenate kinase